MLPEESIFFIQEEDSVCFFSHTFCLVGPKEKNKKKKQTSGKIRLRSCCMNQQHQLGTI